jgi:hypothetical protein
MLYSLSFVQKLWRIIYMTFNITPPSNITNLFENWLNGVAKKDKIHIGVRVRALLWTI